LRIVTTYDAVTWPVTKTFTCRVCGKPGRRSKTFRQTLNPFNRNTAGQPKNVPEINAELKEAADNWQPDAHAKCMETPEQ
jgi:hypothetical protein